MKKIILILALVCLQRAVHAQNKQIKLYLEQIAAHKVYIEYLQKGYAIAKKGLNTIGTIKHGHFSLDKSFFAGLESINPSVRQYARIADITKLNEQILGQYTQTMKQVRQDPQFPEGQRTYLNNVFSSLMDGCVGLVDEVTVLVTAGKLKMSDDERIKRIDQVYRLMEERAVFMSSFCKDLYTMRVQRSKELHESRTVGSLYGLQPRTASD